MKRCFCYLLALVLGALAVGGLVFALLRSGVLTLTAGSSAALLFFAAAAAAGLGGLLAYLLGGLLADRTPALADAWSTALFVLGPDRALELWRSGEGTVAGMELILVTQGQQVYVTQGLEEGLQFHGEEAGYTYEIVRR